MVEIAGFKIRRNSATATSKWVTFQDDTAALDDGKMIMPMPMKRRMSNGSLTSSNGSSEMSASSFKSANSAFGEMTDYFSAALPTANEPMQIHKFSFDDRYAAFSTLGLGSGDKGWSDKVNPAASSSKVAEPRISNCHFTKSGLQQQAPVPPVPKPMNFWTSELLGSGSKLNNTTSTEIRPMGWSDEVLGRVRLLEPQS